MHISHIRRVSVFSVAKVMGLMYVALGLVIGGLVTCFSVLGIAAVSSLAGQTSDGDFVGLLFGVGSIIVAPIMYGIIGFIFGAIMAFLYNLIAAWFGGIEIELE